MKQYKLLKGIFVFQSQTVTVCRFIKSGTIFQFVHNKASKEVLLQTSKKENEYGTYFTKEFPYVWFDQDSVENNEEYFELIAETEVYPYDNMR